ncbi:jerky protein homolog-like [Nilaparvata lugens]|uniref:jerky protein homolog-like n=1 Tax=Nilaparvata lugens TaxID=108931 RepID=UPI00193DC0E9|nr:jerky protein homolog-like [Nilaparvata lugens]
MDILPVKYENQKNAWMDSSIFKRWFFNEFVPSVKKFSDENNPPHQALLLLDNAPTHPDESVLVSGDIRAIFLPPNVMSLLQPLDQGVIENLKRHYRQKLLKQLLLNLDNEVTVVQSLKKINLKDVIFWLDESWKNVKQSTLQKSWKNISLNNGSEPSEDDEDELLLIHLLNRMPVAEPLTDDDVNQWLNDDEDYELSDEAIVYLVENPENNNDDDNESAGQDSDDKISHTEGLSAIEKALLYVEQQDYTTPADIAMLRRLRSLAAKKRSSSITQRTVKDFFKPL